MIVIPKRCKAESKVDRRANIVLAADGLWGVRVGKIAVAKVLMVGIAESQSRCTPDSIAVTGHG